MEITVLGYVFWFSLAALILCHLKPAHKAFMLNIFCGLGFVVFGLSLIAPIEYIGWKSTGVDPYMPDPVANKYHYQVAAGFMFAMFGSFYIVVSIIKWLGGAQDKDETWYHKDLVPDAFQGRMREHYKE